MKVVSGNGEVFIEGNRHFLGMYYVYKVPVEKGAEKQFGFFEMEELRSTVVPEITNANGLSRRCTLLIPSGETYQIDLKMISNENDLEKRFVRFWFEFAPGSQTL